MVDFFIFLSAVLSIFLIVEMLISTKEIEEKEEEDFIWGLYAKKKDKNY